MEKAFLALPWVHGGEGEGKQIIDDDGLKCKDNYKTVSEAVRELIVKFRLNPTPQQEVLLNKHFGCVRYLYNHFLTQRTTAYKESQLRKN